MTRLCSTTWSAWLTCHVRHMWPHFRRAHRASSKATETISNEVIKATSIKPLIATKWQVWQAQLSVLKHVGGMHYLFSGTGLAAFGASNMTEEELMHLRMNHCVSYTKMQVLSRSGACGVDLLLKPECTKRQCNICMHANITRIWSFPHQAVRLSRSETWASIYSIWARSPP